MAEHEEAAAGVLLGMNEGGDPLGTPGNNFEHDISPGPSPALSGGQEAPQRSTELTEKDISARAIQHGCEDSVLNLKRWAGPVTSKPGLKELRAEVIRRDPTARPSWWGVDKLVAWLVQPGHKPPADPDPSETQTPAPAPAPSSTANQTSGN